MTAIQRWRAELGAWAIPGHILEQTKGQSPWQLDPQLFRVADNDAPPPTGLAARRALEALPDAGSVLDVGCGGGAAGLALAPPAARVVGVDESSGMLDRFSMSARARGIEHRTVLGRWPQAAEHVAPADVVVCHHVVYNVTDLDAFALALGSTARARVVVELTPRHPQTRNNAIWEHFWGITRPTGPTSLDALAVLVEAGIDARLEHDSQVNRQRAQPSPLAQAAQVARMCCLGPDRVDDVLALLQEHPPERTPPHVIWWDIA